ncbi:hypothetical protein VTN49DRAFT_4580 [Thermomyces lanuginosus]|uniref:uncharacterized protein n=1 Tax=Thermomyces lanuginosus TaxID=5541 RepID=UPI003743176D
MAPNHRRGPWVPEEDQALLQLVREQGPNNWVRISQHMHYRSPKQCRERFHQNLKPTLSHAPISPEEGMMIERLVNEIGKRWAEIARRLGNRSDNAVKNWWNGTMNRKRRNMAAQAASASRTCNGRVEPPYPKASSTSPGGSTSSTRRGSSSTTKKATVSQPSASADNSNNNNNNNNINNDSNSNDNNSSKFNSPRLPPIYVPGRQQPVEPSMVSPAFSEAPSLEPPALVSDHGSVASASPRTIPSPQLPPLTMEPRNPTYMDRRGSAPSFHLPPLSRDLANDEIHNRPSSTIESATIKRWGSEHPPLFPQPLPLLGHQHSHSVPETKVAQEHNNSTPQRDSRICLSSLLN